MYSKKERFFIRRINDESQPTDKTAGKWVEINLKMRKYLITHIRIIITYPDGYSFKGKRTQSPEICHDIEEYKKNMRQEVRKALRLDEDVKIDILLEYETM